VFAHLTVSHFGSLRSPASGRSGRVKHNEFATASGGELSRSDFVAFLKSTLAQAAAVSRNGAVHYVCMDWRRIGELVDAASVIYGEMLNLPKARFT
jgi:hypothetical protein